ncbi:MAG: hypothetical protein MJ211_09515 [Bacteroidales bacterium]|nr:hypothetical protein [Bacteroidales bacterium]
MKKYKYILFCFYFSTIFICFIFNYINICNFYILTGPILALAGFSLYLIPKEVRNEMYFGDMILEIFCVFIPITMIVPDMFISKNLEYNKLIQGPSIVKKCKITKIYQVPYKNTMVWQTDIVALVNNDTINKGTLDFPCKKVGNNILCYWNIDCPANHKIEYYLVDNYTDFELIKDFAFLENEKLYTYHDYSLLKPDLVYYNVGYNIVYKSVKEKVNDSIINLSFTEIDGTPKKVSFKPNYDISNIDTFLVFKNINEKFEDIWHVCSQDINTHENWEKITDYGYIFHYDVYSKNEIEDSCSQIRNYVLKYKEHL